MEPTKFMIRERTSLPLMLYGVYVYLCSNSLRRASRILEPMMERSHEAIRQWVQRLAPVCDGFDVDRRLVSSIFVDETMIKVKGRQAWLWVAFEPGLRAFLAFRVSYHPQSIPDAYLFLKELRSRYGRKPIWTDGGAWYPEACRWARLEHRVYGQELKNLVERMNQVRQGQGRVLRRPAPLHEGGLRQGARQQLGQGVQVLPQPREGERGDRESAHGVRRPARVSEIHRSSQQGGLNLTAPTLASLLQPLSIRLSHRRSPDGR
jgi:putative transposase